MKVTPIYFILVLPILIGVYPFLCRKICASCPIYGEKEEHSDKSITGQWYGLAIKAEAPCVTRQKDGDAESFLTAKHHRWRSRKRCNLCVSDHRVPTVNDQCFVDGANDDSHVSWKVTEPQDNTGASQPTGDDRHGRHGQAAAPAQSHHSFFAASSQMRCGAPT
jgi:hypothetical protein